MRPAFRAGAALRRIARVAALALLVGSCGGKRGQQATEGAKEAKEAGAGHGEHTDEPGHEPLPKRVRLPPKVVTDAKIRTEPAAREVLTAVLELPGEVTVNPDKAARVAAPVVGRIERVDFQEGGTVKRGAVLALLRVPDLGRIKADQAATQARAASARANAGRLEQLAARGLAAAQDVVAAQAEADALEAQARAAGEAARAIGSGGDVIGSQLAVRAPIGGIVLRRNAVVGQPVTTDDVLATIADLSEVWFLGRVFEKDLASVRVGAKAEVELNAYPKRRFEGTVEYVGHEIDPVARTVTARVRLANPESLLRIGLFGNARVALGAEATEPVLVVARDAIVDVGG
ncbi:MAG TPA: efflux RND transporter periplasmic adaptor subunit, partial [Polyangiaceae bacterium]|nr:efflux RND transporter periplasmic adaptor subunit [Polyangiaceae bacterium]